VEFVFYDKLFFFFLRNLVKFYVIFVGSMGCIEPIRLKTKFPHVRAWGTQYTFRSNLFLICKLIYTPSRTSYGHFLCIHIMKQVHFIQKS